jgi:hypothetical protein
LSLGTDNYELLDLRNKDTPGMALPQRRQRHQQD